MKLICAILLVFLSSHIYAQQLIGTVQETISRLPIANAKIITESGEVFSDAKGSFKLDGFNRIGNKFSARLMGYKTIEVTLKDFYQDTMRVYLNQNAVNLKEVIIKSNRNHKTDSVNLRKDFEQVFNYEQLKLKDVVVKRDPNYRSPILNTTPNSSAVMASIDVLKLASWVGKQKTPISKTKQLLLRDEELNYIDSRFSKQTVSALTKLKGDSLFNFMNKYRPQIATLKKMSPYQLNLYIKESYKTYRMVKD